MGRIQSVDVFRLVAIFIVVFVHTEPFRRRPLPIGETFDLALVIDQAARFSVPFFFIVSGYFWAQKVRGSPEIWATTLTVSKRILFLFLAWTAIYLLPWNMLEVLDLGLLGPLKMVYWKLTNAMVDPLTALMQGTRVHLWFLVGLLCSLVISAIFIRFGQLYLLVCLAVVLYAIGLAGGAYSDSPMGFHADFNFRNGPFFALIFFVTGYVLQGMRPSAAWLWVGAVMAVAGAILHFAELAALRAYWGASLKQEYVLGTYFYGTGVTLIALSNREFLRFPRLASLGPLVLGIYASHMIFVDLLAPLEQMFGVNPVWEVTYGVSAFFLAYALTRMLSKHPVARKLVT